MGNFYSPNAKFPAAISYNKDMPLFKDRVFRRIFIALAALKAAACAYVYFCNPLGESVLAFPDSLTYVYPAQTLLQYGQMWEAVSVAPMLLRTPGYPFFLALIQALAGNLTWTVAIVQNLLSLLLLIPVYLIARQLATQNAARWAAGFCAVSVLYFTLSFAVLTETLCVFLLAWSVYFIIRFFSYPRGRDLAAAAVLLAAAVYVRPAAYYWMFASAVILACFSAGKLIRFPVRKILLFFVVPLVLCIAPWQIRNAVQTGFGGFTSVGAYNLYMWNEDYLAHKGNVSVTQAHEALQQALPPGFHDLPAAQQVRLYKALAKPLIREGFWYKLTHAPLWAAKTLFGANFVHLSRLLNGGAATEEALDAQMLNQTAAVHAGWLQGWKAKILFCLAAGQVFVTVLLSLAGWWLVWKKQRAEAFFLGVYCLYFWMIGSTFFGAYARFRAPFEFVLCILAGIAAAQLWQKRKCLFRRSK